MRIAWLDLPVAAVILPVNGIILKGLSLPFRQNALFVALIDSQRRRLFREGAAAAGKKRSQKPQAEKNLKLCHNNYRLSPSNMLKAVPPFRAFTK